MPLLPGEAAFEGPLDLQPHGLRRDLGGLCGPGGVDLPLYRIGKCGQQGADLLTVGHTGLVTGEVVLTRRLGHAELDAVLTAGQQRLEGVFSLELDEVVGVLLYQFAILRPPPGQLKDLDRKLRVVQDLQRPLRGDLAGVVIVVAQHQLLREPAEEPCLLHCQSRPHGGHCVVESRLVERYHVDVALAEDDVGPLGFLGQIQSVQNPPFGVHRCLLGVHVLGLRLVQDPAAEGHHV
ncbi:Stage II sporulation protein AC, partial [Dysosmobacter welbionis]